MANEFVAHVRTSDKSRQFLEEHLEAVGELSARFASKVDLRSVGRVIGKLHDAGKASETFQRYILSATGEIDPDAEEWMDFVTSKGKIDHTSAGAQIAFDYLQGKGPKSRVAAQVIGLCIASHHSGLIDCLTPDGEDNFNRRMEKPEEQVRKIESLGNLPEIHDSLDDLLSTTVVDQLVTKLQGLMVPGDSRETASFKSGLLIRFLLSCLIDADRLNTADFESPGNEFIRNFGVYRDWETLIRRLDERITSLENNPNRNEVDELRSQISQACLDFASMPKGIYQLTVPTGGGKTLASLRFALNHAWKRNDVDRVIYVIPYTSIIDQNAQEIREILEDRDANGRIQDCVVLEHHSNLTPEEESHRQSLLAEDWDAPVVLTTQVQFLEALFGSGTRSVRRMHQMANAVIILDEVQTFPIKTIHMLNVALRFLVHDCGATVLLCTATQPPLDKIAAEHRALTLGTQSRIIQNEKELFDKLKRVEVRDYRKVGGWSPVEVAQLAAEQIEEMGSALIVVNTRQQARDLFATLAEMDLSGVLIHHLSTNMCPAHRLVVLDGLKGRLGAGKPERVICVSTQLIEAGVDIDFGCVIRYLAGLDSIAQSAGRCNRHGRRPQMGRVFVVNPAEESLDRLKDIAIGANHARTLLEDMRRDTTRFDGEAIGVAAMATYFESVYAERAGEMKYPVSSSGRIGRDDNLFNLLATNTKSLGEYNRQNSRQPMLNFTQSFRSAAREFHVIDSETVGVIVQYGEGEQIVSDLCNSVDMSQRRKLLRRAQRFAVNMFERDFRILVNMGAIHETNKNEGSFYLDKEYYDKKFGWSDKPIDGISFLNV